jgi:hypothetical protein
MNYIIITSINEPTTAIEEYSRLQDWHTIVVSDVKSTQYKYYNTTFLTIEDQNKLGFKSIETTPYNHYSRKNLGYLYAIKNGANLIYDTDDDTIPYDFWNSREFKCNKLISGDKYINPYSLFTKEKVWPRGFDLSYINKETNYIKENKNSKIGVWQGVIDGDSDFDAIYRLTVDKHVTFNIEEDVAIKENCYTPFNTQSTLWNKDLNFLLYIPISVDFRFTDILRSYVAQKIMWKYEYNVGFHYPNTYQVRNAHNYFKDFLGEISMYKNVPTVISVLENINLDGKNIQQDLVIIYKELYLKNIVEEKELINLQNWIKDNEEISNS